MALRTACLIFLCLLFSWKTALAVPPLIADLSNYQINIDSSFNGTRLFVFGARYDTGDVIVAIRGPNKNYMVRKKEQIAGIWINTERMKFYDIPDFYVIASTKPLADIDQTNIYGPLRLGYEHLITFSEAMKQQAEYQNFKKALLNHQYRRGLYIPSETQVTFMGETLFKTAIDFPDAIPPGNYTAEIYLVSDGEIVGMQSTPIRVVKTGLDAFISWYAENQPFMYGITAVVFALFFGWFGGRLFERF